jgi:hypothetical protein
MLAAPNAAKLPVQMLVRGVWIAIVVLVGVVLLFCLKHMLHAGPMKDLHELECHSQRKH